MKKMLLILLLLTAAFLYPACPAGAGPLSGKVVVIDPGHGGRDPGAVCGRVYEKDINLLVAQALKNTLEKAGARVVLTREGDYSPAGDGGGIRCDLEKRLETARRHGGIFLSVHTNSFNGAVSKGPEVFYNLRSPQGRRLAECIQKELLTIPGVGKRSARPGQCLVLGNAAVPSALVELGFISNPEERGRLLDSDYRSVLAEKIKDGVLGFYGL